MSDDIQIPPGLQRQSDAPDILAQASAERVRHQQIIETKDAEIERLRALNEWQDIEWLAASEADPLDQEYYWITLLRPYHKCPDVLLALCKCNWFGEHDDGFVVTVDDVYHLTDIEKMAKVIPPAVPLTSKRKATPPEPT